jgi:hypothetical protein
MVYQRPLFCLTPVEQFELHAALRLTGLGDPPKCGKAACVCPKVRTSIRIAFPASRDDVFKSFQAIANLADKSDGGLIQITVEGQSTGGYDTA